MEKLQPIQRTESMPDIINAIEVNAKIEIYADRLASFKATVARLNNGKKTGRILFSYSTVQDNYYTATRIA